MRLSHRRRRRRDGPLSVAVGDRQQRQRRRPALREPVHFLSLFASSTRTLAHTHNTHTLSPTNNNHHQNNNKQQLPARRPAELSSRRLSRRHKSVSRVYGGQLSHAVVRERIVRAFLIEEQKIVKRVRSFCVFGSGFSPAPSARRRRRRIKTQNSTLKKQLLPL